MYVFDRRLEATSDGKLCSHIIEAHVLVDWPGDALLPGSLGG
jgi:hypothetical protein